MASGGRATMKWSIIFFITCDILMVYNFACKNYFLKRYFAHHYNLDALIIYFTVQHSYNSATADLIDEWRIMFY